MYVRDVILKLIDSTQVDVFVQICLIDLMDIMKLAGPS